MGIPKRGSRIIHIDGHDYRYVVSGNSDSIDLIVESNQVSGQKLIIGFDYTPIGTSYQLSHTNQITPEMVKNSIIYALKNNWRPTSKNKELRLNFYGKEVIFD